MTLRYRLRIFGSLPGATLEALRNRFRIDGVSVEPISTVLSGQLFDQPALRSLLILIWDSGAGVKSLEIEDVSPARGQISPDTGERQRERPSTHPEAVPFVTEPDSPGQQTPNEKQL